MNNNCYSCDYCIEIVFPEIVEYVKTLIHLLEISKKNIFNIYTNTGAGRRHKPKTKPKNSGCMYGMETAKNLGGILFGIPPTNTDFINYMSLTNYTRTIIYNGALQWDSYASGNISYKSGYSDLLCSLENTTNGILFYINDNVNDFTGYQAVTEFCNCCK